MPAHLVQFIVVLQQIKMSNTHIAERVWSGMIVASYTMLDILIKCLLKGVIQTAKGHTYSTSYICPIISLEYFWILLYLNFLVRLHCFQNEESIETVKKKPNQSQTSSFKDTPPLQVTLYAFWLCFKFKMFNVLVVLLPVL